MSLSRPGERYGAEVVNEDGAWTWNELVSGDLAAARDFYVELFGWSADDASAGIPRTAFTLGGLLVGGGTRRRREDPSPRWSVAFWVADADEAAARTQELGGTVLLPPMDIPVGRFTIVADPQGRSSPRRRCPAGPPVAWTGPDGRPGAVHRRREAEPAGQPRPAP